ncbi:MAG TPA: tetratricopeptide repeat protein [Candidatus Saccharimonadaceae bacterium]|nr:tetratricopeptide repeat protein [Candidatus Saccharimonadaceae bacterium]
MTHIPQLDRAERAANAARSGTGPEEVMAKDMRRTRVTLRLALAALTTGLIVGPSHAAHAPKHAPEAAQAPQTNTDATRDVTRAFDAARLKTGDERLAALRELDGSVEDLMKQASGDDQRAAAKFLSGAVRWEMGDANAALDAYRDAQKDAAKGPFEDDAAYAVIRAMEAKHEDADAAKEWIKFEQRYPTSPLLGEARLARAWNALRRGDTADAKKALDAIASGAPWTANDARVAMARAMMFQSLGRPQDAIAALGPSSTGPAATYLKGLALAASGNQLRAAAAFQDVADRWPSSTLHDPALLAKANVFLGAKDYRSAATEFARMQSRVTDPAILAEAEVREAGARFLAGQTDSSLVQLHGVVDRHPDTDAAARAQYLIGEALAGKAQYAAAIVEFNKVLTRYFEHEVAASAQYRVGRCLDAMGRRGDATGTYQAVVRGYPLEPEAPAAAYLAGVGLSLQGKPLAAAPYFQIVLDRYTTQHDSTGRAVFSSPERQELVEAALCQLELAYHRAGDLGQLSGAPHLLLQKMPPSHSEWRAWALVIDADASAAQGRYAESQAALAQVHRDFAGHEVASSADQLLAWTYARQGQDSLAIATEEQLVAGGSDKVVSGAVLAIAHERFNQKRYREAAAAYEDFVRRFPKDPQKLTALYQAGLCYVRLDRSGDAVDRWETIVRDSADAPLAEKAWARAGDLYFQAARYADAKRCYEGLLAHFASSSAASIATLRLAQGEYNAGRDAEALQGFAGTIEKYPGTPAAREAQRGTERALYRLSQKPGGQAVLAKLVDQFPNSAFAADAEFQISRRHYDAKEWTEAADGFRKVVSGFPGYSAADQAQFLLADALAQSHANDDARQAYEQFLSFFPESDLRSTVRFRMGLLDFEAKDFGRAAVAFTQVLAESTSADIASASAYNLALCQRMTGQSDEARTALEAYRAKHPDDARASEVAYQLGDMDETAGQTADAMREYQRALAARPSASLNVELLYRMGRCHEQLKESTAALRWYEQAAAAPQRTNAFRLSALARCAALYETRKEYTRAVDAYRDIAHHSEDHELVAAASGRASQLEALTRRR